ncbi:glycosyltransferase [Vibrio astriarenae]|nr:glycosyltransferase [Vibrio sp. C7]
MKIIVISLERALERRKSITKQLDQLAIDYQIFDAIDAKVSNHLHCDKRRDGATINRFGYKLVAGEIACYASHYEVWRLCCEINEPVIVIEDNVKILPQFKNSLNLLENAAADHDYIKLFAYFPRKDIMVEKLSDEIALYRSNKRFSGAQGYLLTPHAAMRFINASKNGFYEAVDDFMEKPYKHRIRTVVTKPNLVERMDIDSTISSSSIKRKDKSSTTVLTKALNELFRLYEKLRNKKYV